MKHGPASSLTAQMNLQKDDETSPSMLKTGKKQICRYVQAVNFLLESYETDPDIAKATYDIARLRSVSRKTSVLASDVFRSKVVRCGHAYTDKRAEGALIDGSPTNIESAVWIF